MAAGRLTQLASRALGPWWARVLAVFLLSRLVTTVILLAAAATQAENAWTGASPGYLDFARIWDGHWYLIIAARGYPAELPLTADGHVGESAWAFMPVYPVVVRVVMALTGAGFPLAAVAVSVLAALGASLVLYRLMSLVLPAGSALFAVALLCFGPLSPLLQVAYAESLHLLLLATALWLLLRRRYWMLVPVVAVMSLTRPSGLAFALLLLLHLVVRFATRARDPFPLGERVAVVVVGLWTALCGIAWLLIAAIVTGSLTAYTDTELAWRSAYIGRTELVPFTPWFQGADWWLRWIGVPPGTAPWLGAALVVVLVAGFAVMLLTRPVRRLGVDLRLWLASYALYLLAVFFPQSSTFRLLLPLVPLVGALAIPRSRLLRAGMLLAGIALQVVWVAALWRVEGADWTPP